MKKLIHTREKLKAVMVDVDGTLADMRGVRTPYEWKKVGNDKGHMDIIELVQELYENYQIIIMTGRDGVCEMETRKWLDLFKVPYDHYFMRPPNNFEADSIIKARIYMDEIRPKYQVAFILDDRNQVVNMWRAIGLRCLQVAPGDF
jgi:3-deoxy-D-manno-octulosonate 8-phosphate phosphatase KdsC-like HAD superfamily phosphatase